MADKKVNDPAETTGISVKNLEPDINTDDKTANLPPSTPAELRQRAEAAAGEGRRAEGVQAGDDGD
jgi:hypothetical protein